MAGMKQKLLHKTLRFYLWYAVIVLLVFAPLFYFVTKRLYLEDADEVLLLHKKEFYQNELHRIRISEIPIWNRISRDVKIEKPTPGLEKVEIKDAFYYDTLDSENEPYRVLICPIEIEQKPFTLLARMSMVESEDLIESIAWVFLALLVAMLSGLYGITRLLSIRLWRPFYEILNRMENYEVDKQENVPTFNNQVDEFERLNEAVENLIQKNTAIFNSQKEFIENASHELQTPLAVFQGKLENLIQQPDMSEKQAGILSEMNDSLSRISHLNKNLLMLSRLENQAFPEKEIVDIHEMVRRQTGFFKEQAAARNIALAVQPDLYLRASGNKFLAETIVSNLFLNAVKHTPSGGKIYIQTGENVILFSNSASQGAIRDEKLFERFSKINPSASGSGLGLAIVKKAAERSDWEVSYQFLQNQHIFSLKV